MIQLHGKRFTTILNWWTKIKNPPETILHGKVTKILFQQDNSKFAVGVEFLKNKILHRVYGNKIVLCAGTMGSPKILLHSGIGPENHLNEIGIQVLENLPVGENLQDHVTTNIDLLLNQSIGSSIFNAINPLNILQYFISGDGPLTLAGADVIGFANLNSSNDVPDLSFLFLPAGISSDKGVHLMKTINLRKDFWDDYYKPLLNQSMSSLLPILLHPKSVGTIRLKSNKFEDPLIINPKYYDDDHDIKMMITAIRIIQKIIEMPQMRKFGAEFIPKNIPGCTTEVYDSDEYWKCYIKAITLTMYHPVGTVKMGKFEDETTVVLDNFQVKNIYNLYVVDASVIPRAPSANPYSLILMLAHKFIHNMNTIFFND